MQRNRWQVCRESSCSAFPAYEYMILLVTIWVISEKDRTILSADCFGHKAGLAESCSHIASVFFLFRGNYTNSWQARLHIGKMLMDFSNICMRGLRTSSFHRLRSSKKSSTKKLRIYNSRKPLTIQQLLVLSRRMQRASPHSKEEMDPG